MPIQKIQSGRIITVSATTYVGHDGTIFFDESDGILRLSNGITPGGVILSSANSTDEEMPYAKRVDFVNDNELYKGEAVVGSLETDNVWRIHRITIANDSDVSETWADGTSEYNKRWSDRLTYTYI